MEVKNNIYTRKNNTKTTRQCNCHDSQYQYQSRIKVMSIATKATKKTL
jgi:Rieske Fe-S protein